MENKEFKQKLEKIESRLKEENKFMIKEYNLSIKTALNEKEAIMWKHRKEGWELAMEEIEKIFKEEGFK